MRLVIPKKTFILTIDGMIAAEFLINDDVIVKGYNIDQKDDSYYFKNIEYSECKIKELNCEESVTISGYKIFHGNIYIHHDESKNVGYFDEFCNLRPIEQLNAGSKLTTVIKHMIVDCQVSSLCKTTQSSFILIENVKSILLSFDEAALSTLLLYSLSEE